MVRKAKGGFMIHVTTAAIVCFSLYLSLQGVVSGTYVLLFLLGMNILLVSYSSAVISGFYRYMFKAANTDSHLKTILDKKRDSIGLQAIVRIMFLLSVYHIYTIGYIFFAGLAAVTVTISFVASLLTIIEESFLDK
jgi:hypothetical protein